MSRDDLADLTGLSASHLRNVENGHRAITERVAEAVAAVLGTTPDRYLSSEGR